MRSMEQYHNEVSQCLRRLASLAEEQVDYLQTLGVSPCEDELALEFHEVAAETDMRFEDGQISEAKKNTIKRLDSVPDTFSGPEHASL